MGQLFYFFFLLISFTFSFQSSLAVNIKKYWVFFTDKENTKFNPYEYFDSKAIERRLKFNILLNDYTDWPVNDSYLLGVKSLVSSTSYSSRWLNAVAVYATNEEINLVRKLNFVRGIEEFNSANLIPLSEISDISKRDKLSPEVLTLLKFQTARMQIGRNFSEKNLNGKGIRIAVLDAGFLFVNTHPAFKYLREGNKIKDTYDFVKKNEHVHVYKHSSHGTKVLSCIAGKVDSLNIGLATEAEFLLARTENSLFEPFSEEENWIAAAEWADKNGADIINSSLGYTKHRYFISDMNGSSFISRGANIAASKGILVINASGNEGNTRWRYIAAPADADSVLSVGGIDAYRDYHINFSSYGPAFNGLLKPNVSTVANVVAYGKDGLTYAEGTSFACPLVTGFAACAWQAFPNFTNMQLFKEIEKSAHLYPYYDYAHGYGVPQAAYFLDSLKKEVVKPTFSFIEEDNYVRVVLSDSIDLQKKNLYYHIENKKGTLDKYTVIRPYQKEILIFPFTDYTKGEKLSIHFEGYTNTYRF